MDTDVYLELLAREAPVIDYESPILHAKGRGVGDADLAALERAKLLALQVRSNLERHRRREAELAALFETASDLAALRDLDSVLDAIVNRARRLLDTDVAYMTLEDAERGDTYMRVTAGSTSAAFQQLRLPMGAGLGGLVAQTALPYASADYPHDARFRHTREIDGAVDEEGLIAILGVPMRVGGRVLGVLFASDRRHRSFATGEIALLGSFADHAAVAIDSARTLQGARVALQELDAASTLLHQRTASVERAASAHDRLTDLVLRGGDLEQLAAAVTDVLGGALHVIDADGRRLGHAGQPRPVDAAAVAEAAAVSRTAGRAVRCQRSWVAAVAAGSEHLGALVLTPDTDLDDADQRILERAAMVTALLMLLRRSQADAETKVRGDLLSELLVAPHQAPDAMRERARRLGTDLDAPYTVVVTDISAPERRPATAAAARHASAHAGLATSYEGREVLLLPGAEPAAAARAVVKELGDGATAGASSPVTGAEAAAAAYREAVRCVDALLALGRRGVGAAMSELGFVGLVLGEGRDVQSFVRSTIGPVLEYDARRGTELVDTLHAYYAADRSAVRAHHALHVHVNTVNQRLARVGQLLGSDWQEAQRSLEIQLALQLRKVHAVI
ncbi:MAG: GAF domain-containing protein [Streptosporangiales bacterium]|nr:GAF domain-containing protein [Streptosporangiales bacterium]